MKSALNDRHKTKRIARTRSPALLSLGIQCVALSAVWSCGILSDIVFNQRLATDGLFVIQAIFASALAYLALKDFWWRYIHFVFPLALCITLRFDIPNYVFLGAFILSASLFWTCFTTQVPFYPSSALIRNQIANMIPDNHLSRVIDIGSGIGDLCLTLAEKKPAALVSGVEIAPLLWVISTLRARFTKSKAVFTLGSYQTIDFSNYDIVFAYLSPAAMDGVRIKAQAEMRTNALLVSHEFPIPHLRPIQIFKNASTIKKTYVYRIHR